ncbi:hypothetical protein D3C76_300430 [compost metagenome]
MSARRVFAHQQQGVGIEQGHHHDGAPVAAAHPLVDPLLPVAEFQVQGFHLEQPALGHQLGLDDLRLALVVGHGLDADVFGFALVGVTHLG